MEDICAKFVSQKISRCRWRPVTSQALQQPDLFATGSWDNEENKVCLWTIQDTGSSGMDEQYEGDPQLICEIKHDGDVMDLQFLDQERIVTASSTGSVNILRHHQNSQTLSVHQRWERAHYNSCDNAPCTGLVCNNSEIITVGEDGRINHFRADQKDPVRTIDNADSSTLHAVTFLRINEILTVNSIGQLKIWDFRRPGNEASHIFSLTGDRVPLHCVDTHPNQQHIVATGGQDGMLCIWDVRQGSMPVSLLEAHFTEMWEVHFHPSNPDHLFSCSEDGSVWHWNASATTTEIPSFLHPGGRNTSLMSRGTAVHTNLNQSLTSTWLTNDPTKARLEINSLLPDQTMSVNSLDVLGQYLICGTDGEAVYVTTHLPV